MRLLDLQSSHLEQESLGRTQPGEGVCGDARRELEGVRQERVFIRIPTAVPVVLRG